MDELITIKTAIYPMDLNMAKSLLESEGIECFMMNEYANQTYISSAVMAELQVKKEDVPEAIRLLIESGYTKEEDYGIPKDIVQTDKIIEWLKDKF